jgi:eukaryotic translation initiation factor 2-alpha kinase 4
MNGPSRAVVLQISVERIAASVLKYLRTSQAIPREPRTFGYWSPRRCDVYVVSFNPGHFNDRLEVAGLLWKNGISADMMYESGLAGNEDQTALCHDEGVLFVLVPFL